jgi:hypothetical protein
MIAAGVNAKEPSTYMGFVALSVAVAARLLADT